MMIIIGTKLELYVANVILRPVSGQRE